MVKHAPWLLAAFYLLGALTFGLAIAYGWPVLLVFSAGWIGGAVWLAHVDWNQHRRVLKYLLLPLHVIATLMGFASIFALGRGIVFFFSLVMATVIGTMIVTSALRQERSRGDA